MPLSTRNPRTFRITSVRALPPSRGGLEHVFGHFPMQTPRVTCKPAAPPNFQTRWGLGCDSAPTGQLPESRDPSAARRGVEVKERSPASCGKFPGAARPPALPTARLLTPPHLPRGPASSAELGAAKNRRPTTGAALPRSPHSAPRAAPRDATCG